MTDALKKIEEQHWEGDCAYVVVKLARALDQTPDIAGGMTGPGNTVEQSRGYSDACRDIRAALKELAKRTLEEVAGA